ncbi:MAG: MFS transporter [Spirochaetaceae bacterium]|nr:MFS transporter [Spirochaetaceae bacterium]
MPFTISPYRLQKARTLYNIFNALNTVCWTFLAGNIITLFALRLEASSTLIGLLTAINYLAQVCLFLGRILARRAPIIRIYTVTWLFRSVAMTPLLFAPHFSAMGRNDIAITLMLIGVTLFHLSRGIGMVGNNPVLSFLAQGADRGSYMTLIQVINNGVGMIATFALALFLGSDAPLFVYSIIMGAGIVIGLISVVFLSRLPEPDASEKAVDSDFFAVLKESLAEVSLRFFILIMFLVVMVSGVVRTFILVYAREVYLQGDGMVTLYTVFGCLGSLVIGLLVKFLIDRVGAKPIYILCVVFGVISILPALFFPAPDTGSIGNAAGMSGVNGAVIPSVILYLSGFFFIANFAFLGAEGVGQTYFLGLVPRKSMLDMGIVYFFVYAVAGAGGTFAAGVLLDILHAVGLSYFASFRILFAVMIAVLILVLGLQRRLLSLGAIPLTSAISLLFSPRDLRAIMLIDKLEKSRDAGEEGEVLEELSGTASSFAVRAILDRLRSPSFAVRIEALNALIAAPGLDNESVKILLDDLQRNPHTTAYLSARVLGKHQVFASRNKLREALLSDDYMLTGEAMIALARLGDKTSYPQIERIIRETYNPRLKIMGFGALSIAGEQSAIPILVDSMLERETASHVKDEAALSLASILKIGDQYYKLLVSCQEDPASCAALAKDTAESAYEHYRSLYGGARKKESRNLRDIQAGLLQGAVAAFVDKHDGGPFARWILSIPSTVADESLKLMLTGAIMDKTLIQQNSFRLLAVLWAARLLRVWAAVSPAGN